LNDSVKTESQEFHPSKHGSGHNQVAQAK